MEGRSLCAASVDCRRPCLSRSPVLLLLVQLSEVGHVSVMQQGVREGLEDKAKGACDLARYEAETLPIKVVSCGRASNECDVAAQAP
jgi:hypothetical protein